MRMTENENVKTIGRKGPACGMRLTDAALDLWDVYGYGSGEDIIARNISREEAVVLLAVLHY